MYEEAIEAFRRAIQIQPNDAAAYNNLGNAYVESGMYEEAIEAYKEAIKIQPDNAATTTTLVMPWKSHLHKEEIESYQQAIRIEPNDATAHFNLGLAYQESGMFREGTEAFKEAIRIQPNKAWLIAVLVLLMLNQACSGKQQRCRNRPYRCGPTMQAELIIAWHNLRENQTTTKMQ